jgi:hypothetical protein
MQSETLSASLHLIVFVSDFRDIDLFRNQSDIVSFFKFIFIMLIGQRLRVKNANTTLGKHGLICQNKHLAR